MQSVASKGLDMYSSTRVKRPHRLHLMAWQVLLAVALAACSQQHDEVAQTGKNMADSKQDVVYLNVSMLSYYERPIFDVKLNGIDIGAAGAPPHGDHAGVMAGVAVPLGPQVITWRLGGPEGLAGNGDTIRAVNIPILARPESKQSYLGVHIYPDNTVDVIPVQYWPTNTDKGDAFIKAWESKHGQ